MAANKSHTCIDYKVIESFKKSSNTFQISKINLQVGLVIDYPKHLSSSANRSHTSTDMVANGTAQLTLFFTSLIHLDAMSSCVALDFLYPKRCRC